MNKEEVDCFLRHVYLALKSRGKLVILRNREFDYMLRGKGLGSKSLRKAGIDFYTPVPEGHVKCKNKLQRLFVLNSKIRFFYGGDEINKMTNEIAYSNNLIILALEFKNRPVIGSKEIRNALENGVLPISVCD